MKIGVRIDNDVADRVDQLVLKVRKDIREGKRPPSGPGRPVGPGTIAAEIVERVVREHPDLLNEFFHAAIGTDTAGVNPSIAAESRAEYETKPKKVGRKR